MNLRLVATASGLPDRDRSELHPVNRHSCDRCRLKLTVRGHTRAMQDDFSTRVRELAGLADNGDAHRIAIAVLGALGDHLTGSAARELAAGLPEPYAQPLTQTEETGEPGGMDEFYATVADRSGLQDAAGAVGGVMRALAETAGPEAVQSARAQLPAELRALLGTGARESVTRGG
jgi:uncharacterized protein (DUF2267 family)